MASTSLWDPHWNWKGTILAEVETKRFTPRFAPGVIVLLVAANLSTFSYSSASCDLQQIFAQLTHNALHTQA